MQTVAPRSIKAWLNILGFKSREGLSDFLNTPLIKDRSMARQLLRSWVGRRMLDEFADLVVVDEDGNVASYTGSVETVFGSRHISGGMVLNNQLTDFSFLTNRGLL